MCWPRSGFSRTCFQMEVKGSRKKPQGEKHSRTSLVLPSPHCTKQFKRESKMTAHHLLQQKLISDFTVAETSGGLRFGLKSHFKLRKHLAVVQAPNQHPLPQATYLCIVRHDLPFRCDFDFISKYLCLPSKDLVLAQCGKLGSGYKSRRVWIIRIKLK